MSEPTQRVSKNSISIRRRLTWYVIATLAVMSLVSGIMVYRGTIHEADEIFDAALAQTTRVLEGLLTRQSISANREHLEVALSRYATAAQEVDSAEDLEDDGHKYEKKLFFAVRDDEANILLKSHYAPNLDNVPDKKGYDRVDIEGKNWITFTLRSNENDIWIIVGERSEIRDEIVEYIGRGILLPLILLLPLVIFLLWKLIRKALNPLQAVITQVKRQDLKQLKEIEAEGVPTEIDPLVVAFNGMLGKLNVAYSREQRFVSDASHELRNPLAALLINVDNAIEESGDPELDESLTSMKKSIGRLAHLVTQLLDLSHSENPLSNQSFETVNLNAICSDVAKSHLNKAEQKNQRLITDLSDRNCELNGIPGLLNSLIANLIDNAIKYCVDDCEIHLSCKPEGDDFVVAINDSGKGLDPETRDKAIDRFYRANTAKAEGAGLGLSIVKSIADIHSANMQLSQSELGGLCVTIRFDGAGAAD